MNSLDEYYKNFVEILNANNISIASELKAENKIKLLIQDQDYNDLLLELAFLDEKVTLNVNNKTSLLYKKILQKLVFYDNTKEDLYNNYIGTDESGKGDYFGPLVVAGFISNKSIDKELLLLGVKDSKKLSDKRIHELSSQIKKLYFDRISIFSLEPEAYNNRYSLLKINNENLTSLLGISHATVIDTLLRNNVDANALIIDKIQNIKYVQEIIQKSNRKIDIINNSKGEENLAVATASILARAEFLKWLNSKSNELGMQICKGADDNTVTLAVHIMKKLDRQSLTKFVKVHFRTTKKVVEIYNNEKRSV